MDDPQLLAGFVQVGGKERGSRLAGADQLDPPGVHPFELRTLTLPDPPSADENDRLGHDALLVRGHESRAQRAWWPEADRSSSSRSSAPKIRHQEPRQRVEGSDPGAVEAGLLEAIGGHV